MHNKLNLLAILLIITAMLSGCGGEKQTADDTIIRFGTLPVMQSLPLYVAESEGFFTDLGLAVELSVFQNAGDKDIAMLSGSIDGQFADLFTPAVIENNGLDMTIVASGYNTSHDRRMFAVLGKPGGEYVRAVDLADVPIALSSNTVIHNVTETLLGYGGLKPEQIKYVESKNIGIRMQMLMSGQVEAATLPEPLVTAAVAGGATVIADDYGYELSQTVLLFNADYLEKHPENVKKFLLAIEKAGQYINSNPDLVRAVMTAKTRLPEPLQASYPIPKFPPLTVPSETEITSAVEWLKAQGVVTTELNYKDLVNGEYLP